MGDEIELAAKTSGEVAAALAEEYGALAIPQEYASYIASRIHLRHYPVLVKRAMDVAEKLRAAGLPRRAFSALDEPLLTAILEGMAEETDPGLQEAWENLLANTLVEKSADVRRGFPDIMRRLDPRDARLLEHWGKDAREETVLVELHTTTTAIRSTYTPTRGPTATCGNWRSATGSPRRERTTIPMICRPTTALWTHRSAQRQLPANSSSSSRISLRYVMPTVSRSSTSTSSTVP
jgi:hypothetical protein